MREVPRVGPQTCSEGRWRATSARTPLPAIIISVVKAAIALIVQTIASPNVVNNTEATVEFATPRQTA